jgi:hypothetical protein
VNEHGKVVFGPDRQIPNLFSPYGIFEMEATQSPIQMPRLTAEGNSFIQELLQRNMQSINSMAPGEASGKSSLKINNK